MLVSKPRGSWRLEVKGWEINRILIYSDLTWKTSRLQTAKLQCFAKA
jgi:hypothetical protein